jgi:hypothetical protein
MPTRYEDTSVFSTLSLSGTTCSALGGEVGNGGFSLTNVAGNFSLSGSESSAPAIAAFLSNLTRALIHRGIIKGSGTGV